VSEQEGTTSTISDEQIDEIFADPPSPEEPGSEPSSQSDGLEQQLQTIGLPKEEIENLLGIEDPEARADAIVKAASGKADERIRGMQSGFSKLDDETKTKASQLDQLRAMPEFQQFVHQLSAQPDTVVAEELDLSKIDLTKLPEDGMARYEHLTTLVAENVVGKQTAPLVGEVAELKQLVGNLIWGNFVKDHPDASPGQADIYNLVRSGYSLDQAYNAWKGLTTDPSQIEAQTLERVKARFAEKAKASEVASSQHVGGELPPPAKGAKHAEELVKEHGRSKAFSPLIT
jgi:hypothetical protein